jgi:Bacterial Ig-like domain (group 2)
MTTVWADDTDVESAEYDDSESVELYDNGESEDYDAEARLSPAERRRRARLRRVDLARRRARGRMRSAVRPRPTAPAGAQRQTAAAIRNLDLETKVQEDSFRRAIAAQRKRMSRAEYAAVTGAAVNQFIESFQAPDNPFLKAGLRFAPLLLLSPQPSGTGFGAFIKDPRVIGGAAVVGITVVGEGRKRVAVAKRIDILSSAELTESETDLFVADVFDGRGEPLDRQVEWKSDNSDIASIDPVTGKVEAKAAGTVVITAKLDNVIRRVRLKVRPRPTDTGGG